LSWWIVFNLSTGSIAIGWTSGWSQIL